MPYTPKDATPITARVNHDSVALYPMEDRRDFADADRGFIAGIPDAKVVGPDGKVLLDLDDLDFLAGDPPTPDTVNPSLWRQAQTIIKSGLYKVVDGIYQVRNIDIGNLTIVEGPDGLVIIDCTNAAEIAEYGLDMFRQYVNDKPVAAVIYTHTHVDHYGGVKGVVDIDDVASGKVPIIAPGHQFDKFAIGENVVAGNAMSRRASYPFGMLLDCGPQQFVTNGVAIGMAKNITVTYISPTDLITETGTKRELGGLEFEFLYAPDTEAPEEMHIWLPELKALSCAENVVHTLHNVQTLRGARTRDARNFARYIDETLERWGDEAVVNYGPHGWPTWDNANVVELMETQRDMYKYIHDQALRLANKGYTPLEAAEVIEFPEEIGRKWYSRGYHGTLHHDVRAVYTKELGMWDGDPVSLHPHTPVDSAQRLVAMVGADAIMAEGRRAFEQGDYRWASQILHSLVFAQPDNQTARDLQADAYEQMGYQVEGPQWRYIYLTAAKELRDGVPPATFSSVSEDMILAMPLDILFDFVGVHVIGEKAAEVDLRMDFEFTDLDETWTTWIKRGVLNARRGASPDTQLTVAGPKAALAGVALKPTAAEGLSQAGKITLTGDESVLQTFSGLLDDFDPSFNIVTP